MELGDSPELYGFSEQDDQKQVACRYQHKQLHLHLHSARTLPSGNTLGLLSMPLTKTSSLDGIHHTVRLDRGTSFEKKLI